MKTIILFALSACFVLAAATPVKPSYPVLKDQPAEVLFRADNASTVLLECATEGKEKGVKYSWQKDGKPFDWKSTTNIRQRQDEGSLIFTNPQPSNEGTYQCFAETNFGTATTRKINLKKTFLIPPKVTTEVLTPTEGEPLKFYCSYPDAYPRPTVQWKVQSGSDPKTRKEIRNARITQGIEGDLFFSNITKSDVDVKYVCVGKSPAVNEEVVLGEYYLKGLVENKKLPYNGGELVEQFVSEDMTVRAGNVTMIYCIYGGTSPDHPDWFKDGKDANGDGKSRVTRYNGTKGKRLLIKNTLLEDAGTYKCVVGNANGKEQSHTMKLTVISTPLLTKEVPKQISFKEGEDIKIPMPIQAVPAAAISWTYNAKPLGDRGTFKDGVLTVKNAKKSDTGYYGFKAENEHGVLYTETLVNVA